MLPRPRGEPSKFLNLVYPDFNVVVMVMALFDCSSLPYQLRHSQPSVTILIIDHIVIDNDRRHNKVIVTFMMIDRPTLTSDVQATYGSDGRDRQL